MNQLCEVIAGTVNQNVGISAIPSTVRTRIFGTARHAHSAYSPANAQASGRPREAPTSRAKAKRGRPERWQSIAPRNSVTISGSELAISTRCE